jgi:hypothetical protein
MLDAFGVAYIYALEVRSWYPVRRAKSVKRDLCHFIR